MFVGTDNMRFKKPVVLGDQLTLNAEILKARAGIWKFDCRAEVDGKMVAAGQILCADREV